MIFNPEEYSFNDVRKGPFKIYGLYKPEEEGKFKRMPPEIAETVSETVKGLNYNTSGGRIRFKTDADKVALRVVYPEFEFHFNMSPLVSGGFDLYEEIDGRQLCTGAFTPCGKNMMGETTYSDLMPLNFKGLRNITINMPLYNPVLSVEVAVPDGAVILPPDEYSCDKKIVYLGSSITQGASASHPGMMYQNIVSRRLDCDFHNFGWSGSCKCEDPMIKYLETYPMDVFVFDYDHNAPDSEFLRNTHLPTYKRIRAFHPDIPIILMSRPDFRLFDKEDTLRRVIVQETYAYGIEHGDENLFYIDGASFVDFNNRYDFMVDNTHPGDVGMNSMGDKVASLLEYILTFHQKRIKR